MRRLLLLLALVPLLSFAQKLDSLHIMVDSEVSKDAPYTFKSFQEAVAHLKDGTVNHPMTVYLRPGVYWIDDPDDKTIKVGVNGREPFGMTLKCQYLRLIGLGEHPEDVVLASQRGQTQGAIGNFTMFDFWVKTLNVENITMGNYCNVDLVYPRNPRFNRSKRSDAITQAHVAYVHGDSLSAKKVRFISRLNLNPLNGAKYSFYDSCHFECTDDALNGTAIYYRCDFDFYGQKPFWSTFGKGAVFINCDFTAKNNNREMYFTKQGGPLTIINCRYHAPSDSVYIGWTAYPKPWLRCYQNNFTLNGKPYLIGSRTPLNTVQLNRLTDDIKEAPFLQISKHEATLRTGNDTLRLKCQESVRWRIQSGYERYVALIGDTVLTVIPTNNTDEMASFCVMATTDDGRENACHLNVYPALLSAPDFLAKPKIVQKGNTLQLRYNLDLQGCRDESLVTWYRDNIPVATSHVAPVTSYLLNESDQNHTFKAVIKPKHHRSDYGKSQEAFITTKKISPSKTLETDFHDLYTHWQPIVGEGLWTVDGFKPSDTTEFPWSFKTDQPMWEYAKGFNGAVGMGLLQAQRGARLMYTPAHRTYNNMSLVLEVDPTKTAGQGFGSATGQYMDVCLKFDPRTLTGYGVRIIRTTKHAKAVDFLLVKYDQGVITSISEPVSSTCYRTGCVIRVNFKDGILSAHIDTKTSRPSGSVLPHEVKLLAKVATNQYGGIHIQHTGSCGESTTMLHRLNVVWE